MSHLAGGGAMLRSGLEREARVLSFDYTLVDEWGYIYVKLLQKKNYEHDTCSTSTLQLGCMALAKLKEHVICSCCCTAV